MASPLAPAAHSPAQPTALKRQRDGADSDDASDEEQAHVAPLVIGAAQPHYRQALVLAFAAGGSSLRQQRVSLAGLLPADVHQVILQQLVMTPSYDRISGPIGTVGGDCATMWQISFGFHGSVWVCDSDHLRLQHFQESGELMKIIGQGQGWTYPGALNYPTGLAISRVGNVVFVCESGSKSISMYRDYVFVRVLDTPVLSDPRGMCLSPDEFYLAVTSGETHSITLIRVDGSEPPRIIGTTGQELKGSGDGEFHCPFDVAWSADGQQLVVADFSNNRVQCLALDGSFICKIDVGASVFAVATDAVGNILATTAKHVKVFSSEGTLLHDKLGGLEMMCASCGGLAIDPISGRIAVGDKGNGKVYLM